MTPNQKQYVNRLLEKEGISFTAPDLAYQFSNGRTKELKELVYKETQALIESLIGPNEKNKVMRKLFAMAHEMRWELPNGKVDVNRVNAWAEKHTPYHKKINQLTPTELNRTLGTFTKMYQQFLKSV